MKDSRGSEDVTSATGFGAGLVWYVPRFSFPFLATPYTYQFFTQIPLQSGSRNPARVPLYSAT